MSRAAVAPMGYTRRGGGSSSPSAGNFQIVDSVIELRALTATTVGALAWHNGLKDFWTLQEFSEGQAPADDGITAVRPDNFDADEPLVWIRHEHADPEWWAQDEWEVDAAAGNDESSGQPGAPLSTLAELERRWGHMPHLAATTTVTLKGDFSEIHWTCRAKVPEGARLIIRGEVEELDTGTLETHAPSDPDDNEPWRMTYSGFDVGDNIGARVKVESDGDTGYSWLGYDAGSDVAWQPPFASYDAENLSQYRPTIITPDADSPITLETITTLLGSFFFDVEHETTQGSVGSLVAVVVEDIAQVGETTTLTMRSNGGVQIYFNRCSFQSGYMLQSNVDSRFVSCKVGYGAVVSAPGVAQYDATLLPDGVLAGGNATIISLEHDTLSLGNVMAWKGAQLATFAQDAPYPGFGVFNVDGDAVSVIEGGYASFDYKVYGQGSSGAGLFVGSNARAQYKPGHKPLVTGAFNARIGTTNLIWGSVPLIDPSVFSSIVEAVS